MSLPRSSLRRLYRLFFGHMDVLSSRRCGFAPLGALCMDDGPFGSYASFCGLLLTDAGLLGPGAWGQIATENARSLPLSRHPPAAIEDILHEWWATR